MLVNIVITPQITGVMIGTIETVGFQFESTVGRKSLQKDGVMFHLEIQTKIAIILGQGVETMRAGGHNLFHIITLDQLDIFSSQ